jgi:pyruvate/2-oxoglutarate dehydrogenase complex dihydrolipoamide acyltransferase (E2) component
MGSNTERYRFVGGHPVVLDGGMPIGPGEFLHLTEEQVGANQSLVDSGSLILAEADAEPDATEAAVELAKKEGVVLNAVTGTGAGGQITVDDVRTYKNAQAAAEQEGDRK